MTVDAESLEVAVTAARRADDKQGRNIVVLDVRSVLGIIDYFVVVDAPNRRLVRTLVDDVEAGVREVSGRSPLRVEGEREQQWVLIDYGDVVVHIFLDEVRRFYEIERLYRDVPTIAWDSDAARAALGWRSVRSSLESLLASRAVVLADGATGTNYFEMGLESGEPPELWNVDHPENVADLHRQIRRRGCRHHPHQHVRVQPQPVEPASRRAPRVRAGQGGGGDRPDGGRRGGPPDRRCRIGRSDGGVVRSARRAHPRDAVAAFREQIEGLVAGGVDVAWIETMSAPEEVRAAATAAIEVGVPYTATCSFDTAGRTMMGLPPGDLGRVFEGLTVGPVAYGANCGVGAPDILVSLLDDDRS